MLDHDELAAWLRLVESPGIGRETARRLLARYGAPQAVLDASVSALRDGLSSDQIDGLKTPRPEFDRLLEATRRWLQGEDGGAALGPRQVVVLGDPAFPRAWLETADPPLLVYAVGRIDLLQAPSLAIVGSRNPTPQGQENARSFAASMSRCGLTVVSGLALGIDGAAHEGALEGPGSTVAIVGTGLDRVYPKRHRDLAHRIALEGLLVSEYPLGMPAMAANFPRRNRLIAGLAQGTLVVEAALASGSLITARLAVEAGREVFALPGSIHAPQSRGCHALIKQGAKLVECADDILDELSFLPHTEAAATTLDAPDPDRDPVLAALGHETMTQDEICQRTGFGPAELSARLLDLELAGQVARLPGQSFQRTVRA